ncbi:MAG: hypothetical protein IPJ69_03490 [Deltaproteobacteria bacterium]|nr:MAG: hypothetical protein IPJ69_03490 [Deltaproteobacteria bacterium]
MSGFTIIELCLVITLMAILAVAAIPSFQNAAVAQCQGAAYKIANDLSYMRRLSINRHHNYQLTFDTAHNSYAATYYDMGVGVTTPVTDPLTQESLSIDFETLPGISGVDVISANINGHSILGFNTNGYPVDSGGTMIAAAALIQITKGGITRTVRVEPYSGEVSIQ